MHNGYFEGILQLRNPDKELIEFIYKEVEKEGKLLISKEKKVKNGFDLYFTSNKYLRSLGKKLKKNFCGDLKETTKLFSRNKQTSKDVYRLNVLFRCVDFKIGDVIEYNGDKLKIMSFGKKITAKNIHTAKRIYLEYDKV